MAAKAAVVTVATVTTTTTTTEWRARRYDLRGFAIQNN